MAQASVGGFTPKSINSAASNNAQVIRAFGGKLGPCTAFNINAAARYCKIYDKATAPDPTVDTPVWVVAMPGNTSGAGSNVEFGNILLVNGLAITIVNGIAVTDNTAVAANDCVVNFGY